LETKLTDDGITLSEKSAGVAATLLLRLLLLPPLQEPRPAMIKALPASGHAHLTN
jgi:hypothetical protein